MRCASESAFMKADPVKFSKSAGSLWVEGLATALGLLGLTLILAPERLLDAVLSWVNWIHLVLSHLWTAFNHLLDGLTATNLAGGTLILIFLATIALRQRARLAKSLQLPADACPSCGGKLYRIHRNGFDRWLGSLSGIPLRRYRCGDETCGWEGLRRRRERHPAERE
jgi:hypothetical protein